MPYEELNKLFSIINLLFNFQYQIAYIIDTPLISVIKINAERLNKFKITSRSSLINIYNRCSKGAYILCFYEYIFLRIHWHYNFIAMEERSNNGPLEYTAAAAERAKVSQV